MSASKFSIFTAIALVGLYAAAFGGVTRHDRDGQLYLDMATQASYAPVGHIGFAEGSNRYAGSGTLIASGWVLTAGHVVANATSLDFTIDGTTISGASWLAHPKWNGNLLGGYDIGLVKLSSEVAGVSPAAMYTGSGELGGAGVSVGYGMTGTGLTGATVYDGLKRAGENMIDTFYRSHPRKAPTIFLSDFDNPGNPADSAYGSAAPLDMEYLIAPGDSGGGVFMDFDGDGLGPPLTGVHSFAGSFDGDTDSDYGDVSGHIRVSAFTDWINKVMNGDGGGKGNGKGNGKGKPPKAYYDYSSVQMLDSANLIPEPATLSLLAVGSLALLRRRRRH